MLKLILHFDRLCYPRRLLTSVYAVCAVVLLTADQAKAHELEDGFVERSVAVVVRPSEAMVRYSIGANETTRQKLANLWSGDSEATTNSPVVQGQAQEDRQISFLEAVGEAVAGRITVKADGNPVDLELVEVVPTPRHHVEATVVMRVKLPNPPAGANSILLKFHDKNFKFCHSATTLPNAPHIPVTMDGAFRYALKGANGAMLNRSTVAPILVRAKRKLVAEIPADQLEAEQQFSAEVILP